jgi:A/G-specific adenine glycosylase
MMQDMDDTAFRKIILDYWRRHGRHELPWRQTENPYHILVSEIMLQQTQVDRVIPKYREFLAAFPTFRRLALASVADLLKVWQGLGYNRRALMLQRCAQGVTRDCRGRLPDTHEALCDLPGIGPYTAGAVLAFAFNKPHPMIETNIRRVYIHHYFTGKSDIEDSELLPIVERTLDRANPRRWYSALMDYGTVLAATMPNPNRRSKHYVKQSKFEGSDRQIRGAILKHLVEGRKESQSVIITKLKIEDHIRAHRIFLALEKDGFIMRCKHAWCVHNPHWFLAV